MLTFVHLRSVAPHFDFFRDFQWVFQHTKIQSMYKGSKKEKKMKNCFETLKYLKCVPHDEIFFENSFSQFLRKFILTHVKKWLFK